MNFTSFLQNGHLTIALTGEIDHHCARAYMEAISGKIETYVPSVCVLDFGAVSFMDSSGIAVVISALRMMNGINGKLQVSGLKPQPRKVFIASGMEKLVEMQEVIL